MDVYGWGEGREEHEIPDHIGMCYIHSDSLKLVDYDDVVVLAFLAVAFGNDLFAVVVVLLVVRFFYDCYYYC